MLRPLAKALPYRSAVFDLPGHGRSADWDKNRDYQAHVSDIAAGFCDGPSHVIGHSFGATVALRLAVTRPDLVSRLTLIEPVYFAIAKGHDAHTAHIRSFRPFVAAMLQGDETRAAQIFNALWGDVAWDRLPISVQSYLVDRIHLVVAGGAAIEEDAEGITTPARLAALELPVTLIRGAASPPVIAAIHDRLVKRIAGAIDHVVQDAGHMLPVTHTDQVAAIIRAADQETP